MILEIIIAISAILLALFFFKRKTIDLPGPSPFLSLPLVGHGHLLGQDPIGNLFKYKKTYGDIFRLDIGSMPTVFLCEWQLITEATKSEALTGRPYSEIPSFQYIRKKDSKGNAAGPGVASGKVWQEQRRFMLQHLSDLGMGRKDTMESIILQEADYLARRLRTLSKTVISVHGLFLTTVNNVIWRIATWKRTKQDDPELVALTSSISRYFEAFNPGTLLSLVQLSSVPFVRLCSFLGVANPMDTVRSFNGMLERAVAEKAADPEGDFIERCWAEVEKNRGNAESSFHGEDGAIHVVGQMQDIFVAGTDTVSTFLEWSILYMIRYPEIQERVHRDIRDCLGGMIDGESNISLRDNFRLPYVEAVIEEVSRHCPEAALSVPRQTIKDLEIGGHRIPKGTQVYSFSSAVHMDERIFKDPTTFNPDRFLDSNLQFQRDDKIMFFGHGKRRCIGERLARAESFLFFATLFQKFKFSKVDKDQVLDFQPIPGLFFHPKPFEVIIEERK